MKTYAGMDVFLTLEKFEDSGQLDSPAALPPGKEPMVPIG
jgi:hypothetical protein